jgi:anti-anti-sigma factor
MKYSIEKHDRYSVIELNDDRLTTVNTPEFKSELVVQHNNGVPNLILNMETVQYVDSSGLSALLMGNRLCTGVGGILVVTNITEHVEKMLKIAHLDEVLNILPTVQEAKDAVHMHELERDLMSETTGENPESTPREADDRLEEDPGSNLP